VPPGCPFQNRCDHCKDICKQDKPTLAEVGPDHTVACHMYSGEARS